MTNGKTLHWTAQDDLLNKVKNEVRSDMPDLADNSSLPVMLIHPAEDSLIKHQLPNGSMAAWLQDGGQALGYQPLPICCAHQRHQRLPEQPAHNPH